MKNVPKIQVGYTLTELLIVVTILGVVAAIAVPEFSSDDQQKLDVAAAEIAAAMRFARSEAIRVGAPHGFRQRSSTKRVRVFSLDSSVSPPIPVYDVYHPITKQLYDIKLNDHPFAFADTVDHSRTYRGVCNKARNVYFDGNGTPRCADPETVLLEQFDVILTLGSTTRIVTLHGITGRVTDQ